MRIFLALASVLSTVAAGLAGLLLLSMVGHTVLEMVLRSFFDRSTFVLDEFVGYQVAALAFLGLGYALERGALLRVALLQRALGHRVRRGVELAVVLVTLAMMVFMGYYYFLALETAIARGTTSNTVAATPLWIPMSVLFAGMVVFCVQLLAYAIRILSGEDPLPDHREG